jgi:uncharacterized protein
MNDSFSLALVTGASSGIGEALVYLLAEKGINLIIHGRNIENLHRIQQELMTKVNIEIVNADLALSEGRNQVINIIQKRMPDLVINNAGFGLYGNAISHEIAKQVEILEVNAHSVLELTLATAKSLLASGKSGVILNVSSCAGEIPITPGFAVYSASKAFVNHFSQSLDVELQPSGIRVLTAAPGFVKTNFSKRAGGVQKSKLYQSLAMTSTFAASEIWRQIEARKAFHVFDWKTRFLVMLSRIIRKKWVAKASHKFNKERSPK